MKMTKLKAFAVVVLFATSAFAQETIIMKAEDGKTEVNPESKPVQHECYMFKNGSLAHCMGDKVAPQKTDVTLKNGTVLTPTGDVKMKDGKSLKLENGQCVSMMGSIGDCEKMHITKNKTPQDSKEVKSDDVILK
jgi:hypothetical protein